MTSGVTAITLTEWETKRPEECEQLRGRTLEASDAVVQVLRESNMLGLTELRLGLEVKAFSYVGRIRIGDLEVTIIPKVKQLSLLRLLRYAYGFRRLRLLSRSSQPTDKSGFEDLLISQLNAESQELIARGLQRAYVPQYERMASPRGRIDFTRMAMDGGTATATLPCHHHPRVEDTLVNQVLLAGLRLAGTMASVVELRRESRRLASLMEEKVSSVRLDGSVVNRAARRLNRLTRAYLSALSIIRLLVLAHGVVLEGGTVTTALPGFMFDMNAFFQALMLRFLRHNLPGYSVLDEHGLKGMMRYNPDFHRPKWKSPTPRPDYVVTRHGSICSILDAKYRDLWEKRLPADMLYQLVVYAISRPQPKQSSILYPTLDPNAKEARIDVADPLFGKHLGQVCLRPVLLSKIENLVDDNSLQACRERAAYAHRLAFGESP